MAKTLKATRKTARKDRKTRKQEGGKRKASSWIKAVTKLKKENPKMAFGDVLKMASKMKKAGTLKL